MEIKLSKNPPICSEELSGESCPVCHCARIFRIDQTGQGKDKTPVIDLSPIIYDVKVTYAACPACGWRTPGIVQKTKTPLIN